MVPEKYPMVSDIKVIDDSYEFDSTKMYKIYLGVITISYVHSFSGGQSIWRGKKYIIPL